MKNKTEEILNKRSGYQEVTLSNNEVILDIESFRIMKASTKNKEVYYVLYNLTYIIFNLKLYS